MLSRASKLNYFIPFIFFLRAYKFFVKRENDLTLKFATKRIRLAVFQFQFYLTL